MTVRVLAFLFLAVAALAAQTPAKRSKASRSKPGAAADSSARFDRLSEQFMKESLALSPVSASQAGYHKHLEPGTGRTIELDAELDDLSPQGYAQQESFYRAWGERFRKETPASSLGRQDGADSRLLDDNIQATLLELDQIQSYRHNPTGYVELIGNALFLPFTEDYAPLQVRLGHILSRMAAIPRALEQARESLVDSDPIFVKVAVEENDGNLDLIENTIQQAIPAGSALRQRYNEVAPKAIEALRDFSRWLQEDLGKRPAARTWRLGKKWYAQKFKLVMETPVTVEQVLADAEGEMKAVRGEMLQLALPMHQQMYPDHSEHSDLAGRERENRIIGEVLDRISGDHPRRDELMEAVKGDLESIQQFIREKKIVALSGRDNLKVIPTPPFMRGIYSVAGFHSAPPLEPNSEAQYWVTPIPASMAADTAESKLREYNNWVLKWLTIHEALPGHYIQFEHANNLQPENRRLLRTLLGNGAYVEGWAEYIAQIMMDSGFAGNDPRFRMMMRKIRLRVLSNVILDIRMHTMDMSDEQAMDLMMNDAFQTRAEAEGKLQRAKLSSVQLPTYYVGLRGWLDLRKKYQARLGDSFTNMDFHDRALDEGPLPLDTLEKIMLPRLRR